MVKNSNFLQLLKYSYFLFLVFSFLQIYGQEEERLLEDLLANQVFDESESSEEIADYSEQLNQLLRRPLDLNKVSEEDLKQIFFLSSFQIQQILLHREKIGVFISPLELQVIPALSLETVEQLLPFFKVRNDFLTEDLHIPEMLKKSKGSWMSTYSRGLEVPRGYEISDPTRSRYLGTPDKVVNRFRWSYREKLKLSFNMEKDPGEPFLKEKQTYGFDYYSGSVLLNDVGLFDRIVLGDHLLQFGQGLVLWNGPVFGQGASVAHIMQNGLGIRPHTGLMENKFMRGIAGTMQMQKIKATPFISYTQLSVTLNDKEETPFITSINYSGLHRTPTELKNRNALKQLNYGVNLEYQQKGLKLGTTLLATHFDIPLKLNTRTYNQYRFEGNHLQNIGFNYQYGLYNLLVFGETAHSIASGWANNHGIIAALGKKFSGSIHYRNYSRDYHSFLAQSFQSQSNLSNERGWHTSLVFHPNRKIEWMNSFDFVEFPEQRYRVLKASNSFQARSQISFLWYKKGHLRFRYQYKYSEENFPADFKEQSRLAQVVQQQARIIFQFKLNPSIQIGNQIEAKQYHKSIIGKYYGFQVFQDIMWNKPKWKVAGNFRVLYFNTDGFESRVFSYERDVLYSFSFPSYYREGLRFYINKKIKPIKGFDIWMRYAITNYFHISEISSGLNKIEGNKKSDIRLQIRYSW